MKSIKLPIQFYSGTSGLVTPVPSSEYPVADQGKSRLKYFASLFNSLEVNSSFYKLPKTSTVVKWSEQVPDHFKFTFKLSKSITHVKGLAFIKEDVDLFMNTVEHIGNKKGCILLQFPPSLRIEKLPDLLRLLQYITAINKRHEWKLVIEFRNTSWYHQEVYELLNQLNVCLVIHDLPASVSPAFESHKRLQYLRFHGPGGRYRGSYTDEFLKRNALQIKAWMNEKKTVYCYFNNTMGDAIGNLVTLNNLVLS